MLKFTCIIVYFVILSSASLANDVNMAGNAYNLQKSHDLAAENLTCAALYDLASAQSGVFYNPFDVHFMKGVQNTIKLAKPLFEFKYGSEQHWQNELVRTFFENDANDILLGQLTADHSVHYDAFADWHMEQVVTLSIMRAISDYKLNFQFQFSKADVSIERLQLFYADIGSKENLIFVTNLKTHRCIIAKGLEQ